VDHVEVRCAQVNDGVEVCEGQRIGKLQVLVDGAAPFAAVVCLRFDIVDGGLQFGIGLRRGA
jgi:hypothetical protein